MDLEDISSVSLSRTGLWTKAGDCCGRNCKFTKPRFFRSANQKQHLEMRPMHAEDGRFIGHQIRSEGVDCKQKELKAVVSGLDDAQGKGNGATTSEGHFQGCTAVDTSLQAL